MASDLTFIEDSKTVKQSGSFTMFSPIDGRWVLACRDNDGTISYGTVSGNSTTFVMEHGTFVVTVPTKYSAGAEAEVKYTFTINSKHEDIQSLGNTDGDAELLNLNYSFVQQIQGQNGVNDIPEGQDPPATNPITASVNIEVSGTNDLPTLEILHTSDNIIYMREGEHYASSKILAEDVDGDTLTTTIDGRPLPTADGGDGPIITPDDGPTVNLEDTITTIQLGTIIPTEDVTNGNFVSFLDPNGDLNDPATQKTFHENNGEYILQGLYGLFYLEEIPDVGFSAVRYELDTEFVGPIEEFLLEETLYLGIKETGEQFTSVTTITIDIHNEYDVPTEENTDEFLVGEYGSLIAQADGSFDYVLRTHAPEESDFDYAKHLEQYEAVQKLTEGQRVTESFTVKTTDDSGVIVSKTLTYTIYGKNDAPIVENSGVYGEQDGIFTNKDFIGFIKGGDAETADSALKYVLVNDIGTAYVGKTSGTTATYTTEYGVLTLQRVAENDFATEADFEANAFGYKYKFVPNYEHPALAALPAGESFNLPFHVEVRDAQGLASESVNLNLTVPAQTSTVTEGPDTISDYIPNRFIGFEEFNIIDDSLIDAGIGRDKAGNDISAISPHTTYAGDLTASGSFEVFNLPGEAAISKYLLFDADGNTIAGTTSGTRSTYQTEVGTVTLTKTNTGVNYSISANKNSDVLQNLDHNDSLLVKFQIAALDTEGALSAPQLVNFNFTGTNEAPVLSIMKDAGDVSVNANENLFDFYATGKIVIDDADAGDHFMNQTLTGEAKLVPNVVAEEMSDVDQANGTVLVIEGKYGNLTIDTTGNYTYVLAVEGQGDFTQEQMYEVKVLGNGVKATETFTITTTDRFGASDSQNVAFTVTGANDRPVIGYGYDDEGHSIDMTYFAAGVGRDKAGNIIEGEEGAHGDPKDENATYTAVPAKTFIPVTDDIGDAWTPQLQYGSAGETYTGNTITIPELGRFTFAVATVDEQRGYNVTFTPNAAYAEYTKNNFSEGNSYVETLFFSVKDKLGLVSDAVTLNLNAEGSNQAPTMTISIDANSDNEVTSALGSQGETDTTVTGVLDIDSGEGNKYGTITIGDQTFDVFDLSETVQGTFGSINLEYSGNVLSFVYNLDSVTEGDDNYNATLAALSTRDTKEEVFTITYKDNNGATITKDLEIEVTGRNIGPVAKLTVKDDIIIDAGVGRNAQGVIYEGETSTVVNENKAYAGNLTASGTIAVVDADRDDFSFELFSEKALLYPDSSTTSKFTYSLDRILGDESADYGTSALVFTKTPSGYNYTLIIDRNAEGINKLDEGDKLNLNLEIRPIDVHGNLGNRIDLNFAIEGSNEAPVMTIVHERDLTVSLMGENAEGVTADSTATSQITITDLDADSSYTFSIKSSKGTAKEYIHTGTTEVAGTYGVLTIAKSEVEGEPATQVYKLESEMPEALDVSLYETNEYPTGEDNPNYIAAKAKYDAAVDRYEAVQELGDKFATESFTITATDDKGASKSQTVSYKVYGENNFAPEITSIAPSTAASTNAELKAAGYYDDSNRAYAGDLKHTGTIRSARDGDNNGNGDIPVFRIQEPDTSIIGITIIGEPVISGNKITYDIGHSDAAEGEVIGTFVISKSSATATSATYTFTASKESDFIKSLTSDDQLQLEIPIVADDQRGGVSEAQNISLSIEGSNDAHAVSVTGDQAITVTADASAMQEEPLDPLAILEGGTTITDPDWESGTTATISDYTFSIAYGRTQGKEIPDAQGEESTELFVSGKYGNYIFNTSDGTWLYGMGETSAQKMAASQLEEGETQKDIFTVTTTGPDGIKTTTNVEMLVTGANDRPVVTSNTGPDALIMEGYGRTTTGADIPSDLDRVYNGDHTAKGTLRVTDYDGDALSYVYGEGENAISVSSGTKTVDTPFGDLTLQKTSTGLTYTLKVNPDSEATVTVMRENAEGVEEEVQVTLRELTHGEPATITIPIYISDGNGGSTQHNLTFNVQGTNDGAVISASDESAFIVDGNTDTEEIKTTATGSLIITDADGDAISTALEHYTLTFGKTNKTGEEGNEFVILSGTYGSLIYDSENKTYEYYLTTGQDTAYEALAAGEEKTETFTLTYTDPDTGIKSTKELAFTIIGTNDAPVVENATQTDATLIMSGVGRNASGLDVHDAAVSANTAYKGDFVAKGSVAVKDIDGDVLTYVVEDTDSTRVSSTTNRFETEYGDITITKTNSGFNYSLTLAPDAEGMASVMRDEGELIEEQVSLRALKHGEEGKITINVTVDDGNGGKQEIPLTFTVTGTNDAPVIISNDVEGIIDLGYVQAGVANSNVIEHAFSYSDADNGDAAMQLNITLNGTTKRFANIEELTEETLLIEGTYGNVYYSVDNESFVYKSGETDAQKLALQKIGANKVVQDNFSITLQDENGGQTTRVFENKLIGSDIPLGETTLELTVNSTNTTIIDAGVGRDAKGNDITVSANPDMDNTQYAGDFTASGTIAVPVDFRSESLQIKNPDYDPNNPSLHPEYVEGTVVGNTTTFAMNDLSLVLTKTSTGYSYVVTANKTLLDSLTHGEEVLNNLDLKLGDSYAHINIPITMVGTNEAPTLEVRATDNDYTVFEAADGENSDSVSGTLEISDRDEGDTFTYVLINGEKITLPASGDDPITISGDYGNLTITYDDIDDDTYTYTYTLGVTNEQKDALAAHDNYDMQHEKFTLELMDKWGATTSQDLNFDILRDGAPTLDMASALTTTQDSDLYDDEHTDETLNTDSAEGSFTVANVNSDTRVEITGENGITYDVLALNQDGLLSSLSIDGKYGTFTEFAFNVDTGKVFYTYTQFVDAPHTTEGQDLVDSLDVRVLGEKGQVFASGSITNSIENLQSVEGEAFSSSKNSNTALTFTSADADSMVLPSVGASNKTSAGDITATGKLTGTAFDEEANKTFNSDGEIPTKIHFDLYDADGEKIHAETHGIYTKFFSDMGIVTLKQTATGMDYSITLNPEYEGFKDLPFGFTTSFPFTLVATKEIIYEDREPAFIELGREDLGIEVKGGNDAPEINVLGGDGPIPGFTWADADSNDTHTVEAIYNKKTYDVVDSDSSDTSNLIMGKYGVIGIELDGHTHGNYSYFEATDENEAMLQQRWPDFAFTDAQKAAYAALGEFDTETEIVQLKVTDEHGAFTQKSLELTVNGVDNPLVLTGVTEKEHELNEPGAATKAISGFFTYTDADGDKPYIWNMELMGTVGGVPTEWERTSFADNSAVYSTEYGTLTLNTTTYGRVNYSFKLNDKGLEVQKLAVDDELSIDFTLGFEGASDQSVHLNFTVNGTNDAPTMRHENPQGMTVELNSHSYNSAYDQMPPDEDYVPSSVSGSLNINDIDNGDHVLMTISSAGKESVTHHDPYYTEVWVSDSPGNGQYEEVRDGNAYTMHGTYGTLTVQPDGSYTYSLPDYHGGEADISMIEGGNGYPSDSIQQGQLEAVLKLAEGKTGKDSFTITVEDGNGGKVSQTLTFTVNGSNDAPEVDTSEPVTVFASGYGRDEDGNASIYNPDVDPTIKYESQPVSGRIDVKDYEGGTISYAIYNRDTGEILNKPASLETEYGTFTFKYSNTGVDYTFTINNNHPEVIAKGETSGSYPDLPFDLLVSDNQGASTSIYLNHLVFIYGSNNIHEVSLGTDMFHDREGLIVAQDAHGILTTITANLFVTDPDFDPDGTPLVYTYASSPEEGQYGTLTISDTSPVQVTYTLRENVDLSGLGAEGGVETFIITVTDENGLEVKQEVSFTVFADAGIIPGSFEVTGNDSTLIAAGVGRDESGNAYGDETMPGTPEEELTPYAGDLEASGTLTLQGEAPDKIIVELGVQNAFFETEVYPYEPSSTEGGVLTYELAYGTLTLTPKEGEEGQYDYTFTMDADNARIISLTEGETFNLSLNFRGVNAQGFYDDNMAASSVTLTITGSNDAPSIEATADGDNTVDLSIQYSTLTGNLGITDQDMVTDEMNMQYVQESQTLSGTSAYDPDTVAVESFYQYSNGSQTTQLRIVGEYGVFRAYPNSGSYYYSAITEPYDGEFAEISQEYIDAYNAAYARTLALKDGDKAEESFTITTTDAKGASASTDIHFTVIGTNDVPVINWGDTTIAEPLGPTEHFTLNLEYIAPGVGRDAEGNTSEAGMDTDPNLGYPGKEATGFIAVSDPEGDAITPMLANTFDKNGDPILLKSTTNKEGEITYTTEFGKVIFTYNPGKEITEPNPDGIDGNDFITKTVSGFDVRFEPSGNYDYLAQGEKIELYFSFGVKDNTNGEINSDFFLTIEGTNNAPELTIKALTDTSVTAHTNDMSVTWQADVFDAEDWMNFFYNPENPEPPMANHPPFIYDIQQEVPEGEAGNSVQTEEIEGETIIFINGNYGRLVFNPEDTTFTYTVDNAKVAEAMANAEMNGETLDFPLSDKFNIIAKDEDGATTSKPIDVSIEGLNIAPVVENITYGTTTTTDATLIAAGVGRDTKGVIYEDTTAANENRAYAGDLRATGKIEVSDADGDSYVPVISGLPDTNISVSEAVVKGSTYTFTVIHTEGEHSETLGTLVLTKSGTDFNYTLTLSKTSDYIKSFDEGQEYILNLGVQMVDKHGNASPLLTNDDIAMPEFAHSLDFTIIGSNDGPSLVMNHDTDLSVSLGDTTQEGISADTSATTYLTIIDADNDDTHTFSATFGSGSSAKTAYQDMEASSETYGLTIIEGKYGTLTIRNVEGEEPSMTYTLATEGPQYEAAQALKDGSNKETFTITVTDASGATKSQSITYTVRGENNFAPVISDIVESNTTLFDDGFGREANGTDSATWNKAYKGDLTASGTIKATDGDKDVLSFSMEADGFSLNEDRSTTTTKYYDSEYGTLAITSKGAYTFTMKEDNAAINALAHGETMTISVNIFAEDGRGGTSEPHKLTFTIEGTDDGPSFNFAPDPDNTEVTEAEFEVKEGDVAATGVVVMHDVDDKTFDNSSYDYKLSQGKVVGTEDGDIITLEGKYGILIFNTSNNEYQYELDPSNPDYRKLSEGTELFESFVLTATDPKGISGTQELKFTINGSNSSPTVQINATTPESTFYDPDTLYKGNIVIDDLDLDGDTLKELMLYIDGQKIDTTKNGTTKIVMEGPSTEVTMEDGITYTIPGEPFGELSITISGNNCSYVFNPNEYYVGQSLSIPVQVIDKHNSDTISSIEVEIKPLAVTVTEKVGIATEGGQAIVGQFADMSSYAASDWADVDVYMTPMVQSEDGYMYEDYSGAWQSLTPPADVNGMGKPDQYMESEAGTLSFFFKTGQYVFNPASDSIDADMTLSFSLRFSGDDGQLFTPFWGVDGSEKLFTINLTNTHAPTLDLSSDNPNASHAVEAVGDDIVFNPLVYKDTLSIYDEDAEDSDDSLVLTIVYNGEIYEADAYGIITIEGTYGTLSYDSTTDEYSYVHKDASSLILDPAVREMLALKPGESIEEVFTFSVVDKYNARVEENFTVKINGTDQGPQFVMLSGSKDEGVYGTAITGTFTLQDLEDNANVMGDYTLKVAGQEITLANNKSTTITLTTELESGEEISTGTLTITRSGNNYKYSFKGDADNGAQLDNMHNISIEAYAKDAAEGAEPIASKTIDFDVAQKQLSISGSVAKTAKESSKTVLNGTIADGKLTGKVSGDDLTLALAGAYVNGKMVAGDSDFWSKVDMTAEGYEQPAGFDVKNADIVTLFQSDAGDVAFYDTGYYRFIPSGEHSVDENTSFEFFFEDFEVTGADASNYAYNTPKFTLDIIDDVEDQPRPPAPPAPAAPASGDMLISDLDEEFTITDFTSLYTQEVQGGSGNDLVSIDVSLEGIKVEDVLGIDGGEGMDVLLSGVDNLDTVKELITEGKITDMEVIIAGDVAGSGADAVREGLGIVDNDNDGILDLEDNGWSKNESATTPQGYTEYKNEDDSITILVQQTLLGNSQA